MTEEETPKEEVKEEEKTEETTEEKKEEVKPSPVDEAKTILEGMKAENDRREKLQSQQEELVAKQMLGGQTVAGQTVAPKEETAIEYKDRVIRGEVGEKK